MCHAWDVGSFSPRFYFYVLWESRQFSHLIFECVTKIWPHYQNLKIPKELKKVRIWSLRSTHKKISGNKGEMWDWIFCRNSNTPTCDNLGQTITQVEMSLITDRQASKQASKKSPTFFPSNPPMKQSHYPIKFCADVIVMPRLVCQILLVFC